MSSKETTMAQCPRCGSVKLTEQPCPRCGRTVSTHQSASERAKIIAKILTDNGQPVTLPDEATLDDVEWERWNVCLQIVEALSTDKMEICGRCNGTGWMGHPDDPTGKCTRCEGSGGVETQPLSRYQVMDLIEEQIPLWSEDTPPRHALSTLWGKVRDMETINNV